jgi:hypothetical protein
VGQFEAERDSKMHPEGCCAPGSRHGFLSRSASPLKDPGAMFLLMALTPPRFPRLAGWQAEGSEAPR